MILKDGKTGGDYKEIDLLHRQLERQARIQRYQGGGTETDLNPELAKRNEGPKRKPKRNDISEELTEKLVEAFLDGCFDYQKDWYRAGNQRTPRDSQVATDRCHVLLRREALIDALETGRNQIFLSASKAQAHIFKAYIQAFARDAVGVELKGDPIILPNGAELHFLGTNARTAQGLPRQLLLRRVLLDVQVQGAEQGRQRYGDAEALPPDLLLDASSMAHEAYTFWTGERFNKGKPAADRIKIDVSHDALQQGRLCEDRIWRQIVTILDAEARGCDLFDIDELRLEYDAEAFQNLLMCQFVDDGASIFPLTMLQPCMVDSWDLWSEDYKPFALRPFGDRPVWIGYDPAETGDTAGLVVVARRRYRAASSACWSAISSAARTSPSRPSSSAGDPALLGHLYRRRTTAWGLASRSWCASSSRGCAPSATRPR
ncbi:terminase, ATPase subunit [Pseudomonas aeruginosa]|nr:terminase, ATPase subunit [Pseudomonas aeruginosa]